MAPRPPSATAHAQVFDLREQLREDVLQRVERSMGVRLERTTLVYGTQGMTAGFRTDAGTWVRVQWRRPWKINGSAWAGPECASVLRGVAKPDWFQAATWRDDAREVVWRADEMELVSAPVINSTGVIATEPELPDSWWATLKESLAALGEHQTERVGMRQDHLTLRITRCSLVRSTRLLTNGSPRTPTCIGEISPRRPATCWIGKTGEPPRGVMTRRYWGVFHAGFRVGGSPAARVSERPANSVR